ncbi:MAG: NHLP leader peptide family RiPP precursor [Prochloraceae cyanobacterium]|nr:NHLP leader peptide family RiPP precursor [Prochloraceae cyanobacterium]
MTEQNPQPQQRPETRQDWEALLIAKAWSDEAFKEKLLKNPKAVLEEEMGGQLPEEIKNVRIIEETEDTIYISLPKKPEQSSSEELSEEELEAVAGGLSIIGFPVGVAPYGLAPWASWPQKK